MNENRASFKIKQWGLRLEFLQNHGIDVSHILGFKVRELVSGRSAEEWWTRSYKYVEQKLENKITVEEEKKETASLSERMIDRFFKKTIC